MKKSDEQERNIANRLYNLDKKVYETTGSTLGRVFPSSPSFALEKIRLNENEKVVKMVKEGLKKKNGYCPCRLEMMD